MKVNQKEIEAVLRLPGDKRYQYFIKRVADAERLWGLWNDGWAMGVTNQGQKTIPVWPAEEYATLCRQGDWRLFVPKPIDLHEFMETLIPQLIRDGVKVSIFDTPSEASVLISDDELLDDLKHELSKIE
jgi:uncharacterized protein DUF2750